MLIEHSSINPLEQLEAAYLMIKLNEAQTKIAVLEAENTRLKEQLQLAQQRHFGKKKDSGEIPADLPAEGETVTQTVSSYTRTRKKKSCGRLVDFSGLPRFCIHHDLNEADKICKGCHQALHFIKTESTEQLEILPQRFYVAEHLRYTYGCHSCNSIIVAAKEPAPLPKAQAGGSVLTEVVINKYQYHLPLYRQSKMMKSIGMVIPDNTLGNWVMKTGDGLMPVYDAFWWAIIESKYLQVDETPVKILKPEKKGFLWSYYAPLIGKGLIIFELSLTRSSTVPEKRLEGFTGLLQTDGYSGYNGLRHKEGIEGLGCLTHARRKFSEVVKISSNPGGIAAQAIEKLKPLYALEARMREKGYSFHTRKRLRQKIAWPILKEFKSWLKRMKIAVPPKSQLGAAIAYTLNQWIYIIKYVRHGQAEIDTNWVEDEIRNIALGRKNWLFINNQDSGKVHALFYSLILSAIMNNLNPRLYIHYLIMQIHHLRKKTVDPKTLLPHTIDRNVLESFAAKLLAKAKEIIDTT